MLQLLRTHRYELIAFLTGGAVMTLEIVGARLIAPFFGTSIYVWTAMIGVILGSLAVGYWIGGLLADRRNPHTTLVYLLIGASLLVATIGLIQSAVLSAIADLELDLRLSTFLAACLLFAPASLLIGMVSPHLAKIRIDSLETSGRSVGRLEAAGALGSIAGTFACGYFLLGLVGSRRLVIAVAILLLATSLLSYGRGLRRERLGILAVLLMIGAIAAANTSEVRADVDTPYGRYQVVEGQYRGRAAVFLRNDNLGLQSGIAINQPHEPLFDYIRRFHDAAQQFGPQSASLMIGGGAFTFPSILADEKLTGRVDAVEIDPVLQDLAKQYFHLSNSSRLRIIHEDGRSFLNRNTDRYDLIYIDAFSSLTPPFQLTTKQSIQHIYDATAPGGAAIVNVVDDAGSPKFLAALAATYRGSYEYVSAYPASYDGYLSSGRQNYIVYASDEPAAMARITANHAGSPLRLNNARPLDDDFAPVERLLQ